MAAPPMDAHRLVDSLTAHISLYSSTSTSTTATATTAPRAAVLRWFAALAPPHRQAALTVADPAFLQIVLQMQSRLRGSGHGFFLLLPDIPTPAALPSLLFRRSRGLLARASAANEPERLLARSLRLFSSSDGGDGGFRGFRCSADGLDACTVADELVRDVDRFVAAMDGVSGGRFLRGEEKGLGEDWFEFAWLKEKGYYSLEAFVANKLELALRLSWMNATGGKRRGGVGGKAKEGIAGVSANVFWRKKGCLDWWDRMEPHLKEKVLRVVFGKSAKTLVRIDGNFDLGVNILI